MVVKRRCIISNAIVDRTDLFRVVKDKDDNVCIDLSYTMKGRGAYVAKDIDIINKAKKKDALSRALRHKVDPSIYEELIKILKGE